MAPVSMIALAGFARRKIMRVLRVLFGSLMLVASATALHSQATAPQTLPGGLQRVPDSKVALAYVKPGTVWTKYHTIQLKPLVVPAKVHNAAPKGTVPEFGESYVLRDSDVTALQSAYGESMRKTLSNNGFTFVTTPQADTLIVVAQIIDIKLAAPIEDTRMDDAGPSMTFTQGGGSLAISAVLADGASGQVIAEAADRQYPANVWGVNNSVSNFAAARQAFDDWGQRLSDRLKNPSPN
jgi:hypothetical protein